MPARAYILLSRDGAWRLGSADGAPAWEDLSVPTDAPAADVAARAAAALGRRGGARQGIALGVPSAWCLAATIDTSDLPPHDRKAMLYRLEEQLPLAAEAVVADFAPRPGRALGVCARLEPLRALVDALEANGLPVVSAVPAALLAAQELSANMRRAEPTGLRRAQSSRGGLDVLLLGDGESVDVVTTIDGTLVGWGLVPTTADDVRLQLDVASASADAPGSPIHFSACGVDADLLASLARLGWAASDGPAGAMIDADATPADAAARTSGAVLAGRRRPWVELRRGPLVVGDSFRTHRAALNAMLGAAAAFLVAVAAGLWARGWHYDRQARAGEQQMADVFRAQFPGWPVPVNVRAVLESEHAKATGGAAGDAGPAGDGVPRRTDAATASPSASALDTLRDVVGGLPADVPFRLDRMTFTDATFEVDGRLRSYGDADALSAGVRAAAAARLEVAPPQARREADGFWALTLRGTRPAAAAAARAGSDRKE